MNAAPKSRRNPAYPDYERAVNEAFERFQAAMQKLETEFNQGWRALDAEARAACRQLSPAADAGERQAISLQKAAKYQQLLRKINAAKCEVRKQNGEAVALADAAYWAAVGQHENSPSSTPKMTTRMTRMEVRCDHR